MEATPRQRVCEAEDYAVNRLLEEAVGPITVLSDCAGTVGCGAAPRAAAGRKAQTPHLWARFAADPQRVSLRKTKAHVTGALLDEQTEEGREARGNN